MRNLRGPACACALAAGLLLSAGCQPAGQYGSVTRPRDTSVESSVPVKPEPPPSKETPKPPRPELAWEEPVPSLAEPAVPIVFVDTADAEWKNLKQFWTYTDPLEGKQSKAASLAISPLGAGPLIAAGPAILAGRVLQADLDGRTVKIKVPLGLEKPTTPLWNPPTVGKWELGKRLFFDDKHVLPAGPLVVEQSCAKCHIPEKGFTSGRPPGFGALTTPTLINTVYNRYQFWDGRATALEEVVELKAGGEREPANADSDPRHSWGGIAERLRARPEYVARFRQVFGTPPTQDAVAKALATYVRTILSGDSLHDKAESIRDKRGDKTLKDADYLQALKDTPEDEVKLLWEDPAKKEEPGKLSEKLFNGHKVFRDAGCYKCHSNLNFTDDSFHNLGVGFADLQRGRFAALPIGEKDVRMIGAFKTPTLRALPRTAPYLHNGREFDALHGDKYKEELFKVVVLHVKVSPSQLDGNPHLDPLLRDDKDPSKPRDLKLKEDQIRDVVSFLIALDGAPDPVVAKEDQWPTGTRKP
jgi:cytochrome c peroxidase